MKPIVFTTPEMFVNVVNRITSEKIFDDLWLANVPNIAPKSLFFYVETVPGIAMLSDIAPRREAAWTLILFERPGSKYKELIRECRAILQNLFEREQFIRMVTYTSEKNKAAQMIASHIGFCREGVSRKALRINGEIQDMVSYSILPSEVNNNGKTKSKVCERHSDAGAGEGTAESRQLPGAVRDADAGDVPRPVKRRDEPVPEHGGKHAVGDVRVRGRWSDRNAWAATDAN